MQDTANAAGASTRAPDLEQYEYVDTAYGGVDRRNKVRKLSDVRLNGLSDCYASHGRATEALLAWRNSHTNKDGKPTVAGFDGPTWADNMQLDIDAEGDLERALTYLHQGLDRLESWGVDLGAVRIYFSGAKGFHIEIPHTLFGGFVPSLEFHKRLRRAAKRILGTIPFDTSVYDKTRLWRLENSRNAKSGLYKIRLTVAEARTSAIDTITTLARQPRDTAAVPELTAIPDGEWLPVDELVAIWDATIVLDDDRDSDTSSERRDPTDEARDRQTSAAIAASWPYGGDNKTEGETDNAKASRHADYLMPIIGLLSRRGVAADRICTIVGTGAEQAGDQAFLMGREWRDEIKRIADGAAARIKNDEKVKGLPSLAKEFPGLAGVLDVLWPAPSSWIEWLDDPKTDEDSKDRPSDQMEIERPVIKTSGREPRDVAGDAIMALRKANLPQPRVFLRAGNLVRTLRTEDGRPLIETLNKDSLFASLIDVASFERYDARTKKWHAAGPPDDTVRYISGRGSWPFPPLVGISETPIIRPDGTLVMTPGYDPVTRMVLAPARRLKIAAVPDEPSAEHVTTAVNLLRELIQDFGFDGAASVANALGFLITLVVRPAIDGLAPLAVIDKNTPGAGATLLTEVFGIVAHGRPPGLTQLPEKDEELEKRITTFIRDGEPLNVFDNVDRPLEHGSLALVLTATEWTGRVLGKSEAARYPNRAVWSANGNNVTLRGDIARRSYQIRMIAEDAQPWRAEGATTRYLHPNLLQWGSAHRGELLGAILTLARNWFAKGCPDPSSPTLGKFEDWCRVVGGILETAGIAGFLGNLDELYSGVDAESPEWECFLAAWLDCYGTGEQATKQIKSDLTANKYPALSEALPSALADVLADPRKSFESSLGRALKQRIDRRYGERKLRLTRGGNKAQTRWRVVPGAGAAS